MADYVFESRVWLARARPEVFEFFADPANLVHMTPAQALADFPFGIGSIFNVGDVYRHHWGRTLTDGEAQLFATATMNAVPLYFNKLHAQALGHHTPPVHPLLVMNVVFGMTVEDLSEQAIAHLGYWNMKFPAWVYPGDTLISSSEVLDKRESGSKPDRGIVHVRTTGRNQRVEEVCVYERKILVKKRSSYGGR